MLDKTATYQTFQEIIAKPGCPICRLGEFAAKTYLDTLLWESSTDPNLHELLAAPIGFCGRHSRQLLTFGGQRLAAAVVERASLLAAIRRLPELAALDVEPAPAWFRLNKARARKAARLAPRDMPSSIEPCPACIRQFTEEARGIEALLEHWEEFSGPLRRAGGLCLPHFVHTARAADSGRRASLLTLQQAAWTVLAEDLEEFISKQLEHNRTEPTSDAARLAVERTIRGLTGEYPAREG